MSIVLKKGGEGRERPLFHSRQYSSKGRASARRADARVLLSGCAFTRRRPAAGEGRPTCWSSPRQPIAAPPQVRLGRPRRRVAASVTVCPSEQAPHPPTCSPPALPTSPRRRRPLACPPPAVRLCFFLVRFFIRQNANCCPTLDVVDSLGSEFEAGPFERCGVFF